MARGSAILGPIMSSEEPCWAKASGQASKAGQGWSAGQSCGEIQEAGSEINEGRAPDAVFGKASRASAEWLSGADWGSKFQWPS